MAGVSLPLSARGLERAPASVASRPAVPVMVAGDDMQLRYATDRARTVCRHLPFAVAAFLVTYAGVAVFELWHAPQRFWLYAMIYALGAAYCGLTVALTRAPDVPPARVTTLTTLVGVLLIVNTSAYHIISGGEAEVLALGNLYLVIGFLTAFPLGGGPQFLVALTGCAGLLIGLATPVSSSPACSRCARSPWRVRCSAIDSAVASSKRARSSRRRRRRPRPPATRGATSSPASATICARR